MFGINRLSSVRNLTKSLRPRIYLRSAISEYHIKRPKNTSSVIASSDLRTEQDLNGEGVSQELNTIRNPALDFQNFQHAFRSKTTLEITKALLVYRMCAIDFLVEKNIQLLKISRALLGKRLFGLLMKSTFYGHFVAGEEQDAIRPKIQMMEKFGVGAILDYAVEADVPSSEDSVEPVGPCEEVEIHQNDPIDVSDVHNRLKYHRKFSDRRDRLYSARTYIYEGEEKCDENMKVFLQCIDTTGNTSSSGFAAIKLTALGRPLLLLRLSQLLNQTQYYFDQLASKSDILLERTIAKDTFYHGLQDLGVDMTPKEADDIFDIIDISKSGDIDIIEWHNFLTPKLKLTKLFRAKPNVKGERGHPILSSMTDSEIKEMENMRDRLFQIAELAEKRGVRLMVDAEQTYFQPAISRLTLDVQREFNRDVPVVLNTYQCYLKETYNTVTTDMELSRREGFCFGAKLVRGAYMEQERVRAATVGYPDPIHPNYQATHDCYHRVLSVILDEVKTRGANVMIASHNEDSIKFAVQRMAELGIDAKEGKVFFGQLLGMCDAVTYALGQAGYAAYKYVPYGPVEEVLPYLSRRAMENRGMLQGVVKERNMLWNEMKRRIKEGELSYDPAKFIPASA